MVSSKNFKYKKWAEKINPPQHLTKNLFFALNAVLFILNLLIDIKKGTNTYN